MKNLAIEAQIEKVSSISEIVKFGVMMTPALAVDGGVKSAGKVLTVPEVIRLLTTHLASL